MEWAFHSFLRCCWLETDQKTKKESDFLELDFFQRFEPGLLEK